jgi:hypothetical protein
LCAKLEILRQAAPLSGLLASVSSRDERAKLGEFCATVAKNGTFRPAIRGFPLGCQRTDSNLNAAREGTVPFFLEDAEKLGQPSAVSH